MSEVKNKVLTHDFSFILVPIKRYNIIEMVYFVVRNRHTLHTC